MVEFTRKDANVITHTLTRVATYIASSQVYDEMPNCIEDLIISERS